MRGNRKPDYATFIRAVEDMRTKQNTHFSQRTQRTLIEAMRAESRVDDLLARLAEPDTNPAFDFAGGTPND